MYHSVADGTSDPYAVTREAFEEQLSWLAAANFHFLSLASFTQSIKIRTYKALRDAVVITFDDGYADVAADALPILRRYTAPATVFLVTGMLGGRASWNPAGKNLRLLTMQEVHYIKEHDVSLGSHTATHVDLTTLAPEELRRQLLSSRELLDECGESFHALSYPWGRSSEDVVKAVITQVTNAQYDSGTNAMWRYRSVSATSRNHEEGYGSEIIPIAV